MSPLSTFAIIGISFLLSLVLTTQVRKVLLKRAVLDMPNERSSHTVPTPRGGGWAIVIVLIPGLIVAAFTTQTIHHYGTVIAAVTLLALVSWFDDKKGLSARLRLGVHLLAAVLGTLSFNDDQVLFGGLLPFWLDRIVIVVGWAWFMNLYNFMDGIDGITSTETISIATAVCIIMGATNLNIPFVETLTLLLTGSSLGFLAYNWHPAKIFLGDIGSVPLGFLTGFVLITLAVHGMFAPALIIPLYYLADSGITITRRALRGEKIWQPHRQHFYQIAARGLGRHDYAVYGIIACNIGLFGSALLALPHPFTGLASAIVIVAILLGWLHKVSLKQGPT